MVALFDRYYGDPNSKLAVLGKILCAVGSGASLISLSGDSHTLKDYYKEYVGSGCTKTFVDYPFLICAASETVLSKNCISGLWDTRFLFNDKVQCYSLEAGRTSRLDAMRQPLRMAIETGNFSLPGLVDVVSNIVGLWPLIVSHLKETGRKDSGDSLVVWFILLVSFSLNCRYLPVFCCLEKRDRWKLLHQSGGQNEVPSLPPYL